MSLRRIRVGILGGGQLARMMALAAADLSIDPRILASSHSDCALEVVRNYTIDSSDEEVQKFIDDCDILTTENEFLDLNRYGRLTGSKPIFPSFSTLAMVQSKLEQKDFLKRNKIPTLDYINVRSPADLDNVRNRFGGSFVLKRANLGYDGRGNFFFRPGMSYSDFFEKESAFNGYAEPLANFKKELAVVTARSRKGEVKSFPVVETFQKNAKCDWVMAPARVSTSASRKAVAIAEQVVKKAGGVGVFGIEMFLLKNNEVVVNEIAPRVHNSGHFTINACLVSQFEQHLRAITGLPLLNPKLIEKGAAMVNIIGETPSSGTLELPKKKGQAYWVHWYGKTGEVSGRKLGHINAVAATAARALAIARNIRRGIAV